MNLKNIRLALLVIAAILFGALWVKWQQKYHPQPVQKTVAQQVQKASAKAATDDEVPSFTASGAEPKQQVSQTAKAATAFKGKTISVNTDVLALKISLKGGNIVYAALKQYPDSLHSKQPVVLLSSQAGKRYVAQSGILGHGIPTRPLLFKAEKSHYQLGKKGPLVVKLVWHGQNGITLVKRYTLKRDHYAIHVQYQILNHGHSVWKGRFYGQLLRQPHKTKHSLLASYTSFTGAVVSTTSDHHQKLSFKDLAESNLNQKTQGGWVAMTQHYFISAWVPGQQQQNRLYSRVYPNQVYGVGVVKPSLTVKPGATATTDATLYIGPAIAKRLNKVAPYLNLTIDYGWLWFISDIIFYVMAFIFHIVGNWGWSIILVTILIKILFYPLSAKSYRSMAKMRQLQPKMAQLKERYGDDRQKMGQATMALYREEKVNPLSGCLPMVIQIPVFIALYWVLIESVELRQAPFIFWIKDLSQHDPYYILPVLMGLSMFAQQRLNPKPPDPTQAKVMMFLPVIFTVMFLSFPSGLVLYWLVNNVVSILQQWWITRRVEQSSANTKWQQRKANKK